MTIIGHILLAVYIICMGCILVYSLAQGHLTLLYLRSKRRYEPVPSLPEELPRVTVQLPIYNELYVVERLIRKVVELDYPGHLLEIQVLDDSTDQTVEVAGSVVAELAEKGVDIKRITRTDRQGFKAGALAVGLERASGEFIAVFDADFLPKKEFLLRTIPYFQDSKVGLVQTKWEHLNQNYNLLTRLLAMALDAHFTIEQKGRNSNRDFMNFNGTAGVWRRRCIEDSGGWSADTLTEDLDLSYRAQLKGWKMKYLEEFASPAEIPVYMQALRSQQYRWNKGGAEVARKYLRTVLHSKLPLHVKFHALFHLLNTGVFLCIFLSAVVSVPLLIFLSGQGVAHWLLDVSAVFLIGFLILSVFYWVSIRQRNRTAGMTTLHFLCYFPVFLSVSMGLSLFNAIAVLEGYLGIRSPFVRTPKFNIVGTENPIDQNQYIRSKVPPMALVEGLLALYFGAAIWYAWQHGLYPFVPYHALLFLGFGAVFYYSVKHSIIRI